MSDNFISSARSKMQQALDLLKDELVSIRAGRATSSLVEKVSVPVYGDSYDLIELAQISAPESDQIMIQPYDSGIKGDIRKAIEAANLGLTSTLDGEIVRVIVPPLTEERREELVKTVHKRVEAARIMIRQVRQEVMDEIDSQFEEKSMSEDEKFRLREKVQDVVDEFNDKVEELGEAKIAELRQV